MTPLRVNVDPDVISVQSIPLDEVRIVPEAPTVTNILFPYVTSLRLAEVLEVLEVHKIPSIEVMIVPSSPTATKVFSA